jgi:hypothetical protein
MAQEFLHGADIIGGFEEMGGEAVTQSVTAPGLCEMCFTRGPLDGPL